MAQQISGANVLSNNNTWISKPFTSIFVWIIIAESKLHKFFTLLIGIKQKNGFFPSLPWIIVQSIYQLHTQ